MKKTLLAVMALVSLCGYAQLPAEGFEGSWPPEGWTIHNNGIGTASSWQQSDESMAQPAYEGNYAAYLNKENVSNGTFAQDWLTTPSVTIGENMVLGFFSRLTLSGEQGSIYKLLILPDGGDANNLSDYIALEEWTELEINPVQTDYNEITVNIPSSYTGQSVRFAFFMEGDDYDRWLIDNVKLYTICPAPVNISITSSTLNSIVYTWADMGADFYDYLITTSNILPAANIPPTGTAVTNTVTVVGLEPGIEYKFYVRAHCADGGISEWSGYPEEANPVDGNIFSGKVTYDINGDGICDAASAGIPYIEVQVSINEEAPFSVFTNEEGQYKLYNIGDGVTNLSLQVVASELFTPAEPLVQEITFSEEINNLGVTHCLATPSAGNDLSVVIIPLSVARPGLPATYRIIAHNAGSTTLSNVVLNVAFDDQRLDYSDSQYSDVDASEGNLTINLGTMQAFSVNNGDIVFDVLTPPVNVGGESLSFTASVSDIDDISPDDNISELNQVIVNSFDPNDITVHEGAEIYEEQAEDYLTYTIRFQNTGTAEAINIKLTNTLDALLDWETFKPLHSSHNYIVKRTDDFLEFEYKNINLPDDTSNEPGSHGYVTFKIKPKAGFGIGDIVSSTAEIYFDFNEAIVTNTATTEVVALAGLNDNKIAVAMLYPNPVKDQLFVEVKQGELQSVTIHDINGRLCLTSNKSVIDTNSLTGGIYFVKVTSNSGSANYKIIKH
jgi:hypothetical protein